MRLVLVASSLALVACGSSPEATAPGADGGSDSLASSDGPGSTQDGSTSGDGPSGDSTTTEAGPPRLTVVGNHLSYNGKTTRLLGVDHSGSEYSCIGNGGYAIFEGPDPDTIATAILTWGHANAVRLPLNEDCWLGINGVDAMYSGTTYQSAITSYANTLHSHGLFTIVDLHWNAPGTFQALGQEPMADKDHAIDFWTSVAKAFASDGMTVFDLYNEPYVDTTNAQTTDPWACWLSGCTITQSNGNITGTWQSAGMQDLVTAVRTAGATNVLMLGGLAYSNDLSEWLAHVPTDPLDQLAASFHLYNFNTCDTQSCWEMGAGAVAAQHPVITGELGENDCTHTFIDTYMPWADTNGISYLGWTWNTWDCDSGPALITDYDGGATGFGQGLMAHLMTTMP